MLSFGISMLGVLALCIGIIFAAPLVSCLWGAAYLMMSGQLAPYAQQQYMPGPYGSPGPYGPQGPYSPQPMAGKY